MSDIQKIRDKYARWAVIAIALSLLGFILMDAFSGRANIFGGTSTTIGKINDKKIDYIDFEQKVKAQEEVARQQGYDMGDAGRQQIIETVWNQEVTQTLMQDEFEELGLTVGKKELNEYLFGNNPPQDLRQRFSNPTTGEYNSLEAQQFINNIKKSGKAEDKAQLNEYLGSLETNRLMEKYTTLLTNTTYYAKWFLEKQNSDNSLIGGVSYISVPYGTISDSAVKVSNDEIEDYINEHKKEFEQKEETRSIAYVNFNAAPTAADSATVRTQVQDLKSQFLLATDQTSFIAQHGSQIPFFDGYVAKSKIQMPVKDSLFSLTKGAVYGPYLDGPNYVLAKMIDSKPLPDSVKCRHILLGTINPQTGQPIMADSIAKMRIDSIAAAIRGGANFDTLETRYTTDVSAHQQKGVMTFSSTDIQGPNFAKEFGDFILLSGKPGDKQTVKTSFGWHYIEILEHQNVEAHYKIAYLAKPIVASTETDNAASNQANMFAGESRNLKAFNANWEKNLRSKGYNKIVAADIRESDYSITGIGASRPFVKAIFSADEGDVLQPERVADNYVVAVITEVNEAGVQSVSKARGLVEPILRNKKKAALIKQRIGTISTLESASAKINQPIQTADSIRFNGNNAVFGYELKVIGAVFSSANKGKVVSEAIEGQAGVYVLRVDNITATPVVNANIEQQRQMLQMQARQAMMYRSPVQGLKAAADIEDNRAKFY
ncbi:MAG: SurA N-terminal domain-containing protein [Chitinophagaceae bacterium]